MEIRKILTAEQIEQRNKKRTRILTILMLILLLGSTAGYSFFSGTKDSSSTSEGIQQVGNQWVLNSNGAQFAFSSSPDSAKEINITSLIYDLNSYSGRPLYISSNSPSATYEISTTLGRFASRVQEACYGNCSLNLPEKDCTSDLLVVYNESDSQNEVYQENNCVFINGNITAVDAFLYKIMGLI